MRSVLGVVALASMTAALVACKSKQASEPPADAFPVDAEGQVYTESSIRAGAVTVDGRLPPEVVQRVVRQNFGRFRLCYVGGLGANPGLQGRVTVKFVIDQDGKVASPSDGGSDLPDTGVVKCVVQAFGAITFPTPETGTVAVVYSLLFTPPGPGSP